MPEILLKCAETINILQFFGIGVMFILFYKVLEKRFDSIDKRFDTVYVEISLVNNDIKELRTSLNRMEGAFYSKECCMLKDESQIKKAE